MWDITEAQEQLKRIQNKKVGEQDDVQIDHRAHHIKPRINSITREP